MAKIYKTQEEVNADVIDNNLIIRGDVSFEFSVKIAGSLIVTEGDITACDITAWDIKARDITGGDIEARNIVAGNIKAGRDIKAEKISFYAVAFAYSGFKCKSIFGRRKNSKYFCLDSEVEINKL